jgi:hypothetical protein
MIKLFLIMLDLYQVLFIHNGLEYISERKRQTNKLRGL